MCFLLFPSCTCSLSCHPCSPSALGLLRKTHSQEMNPKQPSALGWAAPRTLRTAGPALTTSPWWRPWCRVLFSQEPRAPCSKTEWTMIWLKTNERSPNCDTLTTLWKINLTKKLWIEWEGQPCAITCDKFPSFELGLDMEKFVLLWPTSILPVDGHEWTKPLGRPFLVHKNFGRICADAAVCVCARASDWTFTFLFCFVDKNLEKCSEFTMTPVFKSQPSLSLSYICWEGAISLTTETAFLN